MRGIDISKAGQPTVPLETDTVGKTPREDTEEDETTLLLLAFHIYLVNIEVVSPGIQEAVSCQHLLGHLCPMNQLKCWTESRRGT